MAKAIAILMLATLGILGIGFSLWQIRAHRHDWWQIHVLKRLAIGLMLLVGGQFIYFALYGMSFVHD